MPKEDRRIKRTRRLLHEALIELTSEKAYDDLTVQEITEQADVGHRTFYRHYTDKDELLIEVMQNTLGGLKDLLVLPSLSVFSAEELGTTPQDNARKLFEYVNEHERLFRILFQTNPAVYQSLLELAREKTTELLRSMGDENESPIPYHILANHLTVSTIELMKLWLNEGKPYSVDEMGNYLVQMVNKPVRQLFSKGR